MKEAPTTYEGWIMLKESHPRMGAYVETQEELALMKAEFKAELESGYAKIVRVRIEKVEDEEKS